jgi:type IV secretion system protein VirD4
MSRALDAEASGITLGEQHVGRPLLTPDEIRNLPQEARSGPSSCVRDGGSALRSPPSGRVVQAGELAILVLFLAGQRPVLARKLRYYEDREFAGLYDAA